MSALCPLLSALFLALLYLLQTANGASYFGDSYCRIDAVQDLSSFQVSLQFKTSRRSGLLLLAAGHKDYLSLELFNGRLQARIDMGSGEKVLSSTVGLQLSNLLDHDVSLILKDSKLTMAVDNLYETFIEFENKDEDLNIDQGVFLGGVKDLEVEYLSTAVPSLRGCMSNVMFESHDFDILASAATVCYDYKESCSSEFEAGDGDTTSFISPESFISFPTWTRPSSGSRSLEMLMKTTIEDALLLFHPGDQENFIAIGMAGGFLKGVMDLGSGMYVLNNVEVKVDDDQWHRVKVQINPNEFQINVDSQLVSLPLNETEKLHLVGNLYLGGIQRKMKDVFQGYLARVEEEVTTESFIGCLGEIKVNQKGRSLQDALVTKDIHVKCEGEYDYSTYDEDLEFTTTTPVRITYINANTDERHCFPTKDWPEMFRNISRLLDITPLLVPEGGDAVIDTVNLNPTFNLKAAGVRESEIIFTLLNNPWYGVVDMNLRQTRVKKFTLLDVVNKKIKYLHDSTEKYGDQIQLEVTVHGTNLPECLSAARRYVLPVEIIPVNDIPQLSLGDISITANGRTRLSPNLIKISDSDNRCDELKVTVTSEPTAAGYLENAQRPGFGLREFTCRQLKEGNIYYVHKGGEVAELTLQVSDGDLLSHSSTFKFLITQPQMTLVTNTGLMITQDESVPIGIQNLAISATPKTGDVVYNVTQPLQFGELQLISDNGVPKRVTLFHQSDLEQNQLQYVPNLTSDLKGIETEFIHFNAQLGQVILPDNLFMIKIMPALTGIPKSVPLEVEDGQQKVIKPEQLQAFVRESNFDSRSVQYIITKSPVQGVLMLLDKELSDGDTFTQQDILNGFISYSPRVRRAVDFEDQFQFKVFAEDQYSKVYTFPIKIKADSDAPVLINERLVVLEGNENIINKEYLWVQTSTSTDFVYRIVQDPKHGRLIRDSPPGVQRFDGAIRVFSNEDLSLNRLVYKHDGSETSHDQFTFMAFDSRGGNGYQDEGHEVLRGVFNIAVQSRNDYAPQRVIHKPFNVVRNGQRLLTTNDILFKDDDSDFNDTQLIYVRVGILSGNIVSAMDPTQPLYRFTQADLRDRKVLFVHHGADRERFQLQVSDGLHKTTTVLQVQAGDPYLHIANNTMVVMDHGSTKTLNTSLLSAETNMDIRSAAEIVYDVTSPPSDGRIIVSGIESSTFTQEDLTKGVVSYEHNEQSLSSKDSFAFTVEAKGWSMEGTFRIKIFKKGYLSQPQVVSNQVILAFEGEHSVIDSNHLEVMQRDILPKEMVYSVKEFPRLGHVVKLNNNSDSTASPVLDYIQSFTQEDINLGRIFYVSASLQGQDHFTVDVSNGFTTAEDLEVQVVIVPRIIPIQVVNLTVREGGSVALTQEVLNITHHFYRSLNIDFILGEAPQHGDIKYLDEEDGLVTFSWEDVRTQTRTNLRYLFLENSGAKLTNIISEEQVKSEDHYDPFLAILGLVERSISRNPEHVLRKYKLSIKQKYESERSSLSGERESFSALYNEPVIIQKNENGGFKNISVDGLFRSSDSVTVILQGDSGSGKSIIGQKIMLDWASETCRHLYVVFNLRCEELICVSKEMNLTELLSYSCSLTSDQISQMLQRVPENVLFIIDGFDELRLTQAVFDMSANTDPLQKAPPEVILCSLLRRFLIPASKLLVTTRTKNTVNKLLEGQLCFTEIMGFSKKKVEAYFQRFFSKEYDCVRANETLLTACSIPVICWIVSEMFKIGADVTSGLETTTSIYVDFVSTLLEHHCQDLNQSVPSLLKSLGQLADKGMLEQQVMFDEKSLFKLDLDPAGSPFLCRFLSKRRIHQETMFTFMYHSFQEFFTVLYYVLLNEKESQRKVRELLHTVERGWALSCWSDRDFSMADVEVRHAKLLQPVILFLCGVCKKEWMPSFFEKHNMAVSVNIETQLKEWISTYSQRYQNEHLLFILHCLYELHEKSFIRIVLEKLVLIDLSNSTLKMTDCWMLKYCLQCCEHIRILKLHVTSDNLRMLQSELYRCKELGLMMDHIPDDVVGLVSAAAEGKILNKLNMKMFDSNGKLSGFCAEITVSVRDGDIMLSFSTPVSTEITLTSSQSFVSTINWVKIQIKQEFSRPASLCSGQDRLLTFLQSVSGLKKVCLQKSFLTKTFASEILSLIQACPSLNELSINFRKESMLEETQFMKTSLEKMGWTLTFWGKIALIKPCMERLTEEKLKTKCKKSEGERTLSQGESSDSVSYSSLKAESSAHSPSKDVEVFTPDLSSGEDKPKNTYRFVCAHAGQFRCSLTSLVFVMESAGEVLYRVDSWDPRLLDGLGQMQPAGPLYDIDCFNGSISGLHFPHCEIFSEENKDILAVAHLTGGNVETMKPLKVTETHVMIDIRDLSLFGLLRKMIFPSFPVIAQVILFLRPITARQRENILDVHLLPWNIPLSKVKDQHKESTHITTSSKCSLIPGSKYRLCCEPVESTVQPKTEKFECNFGPNYHPTFEVFLNFNTEEVRLSLSEENKTEGKEVWVTRRVVLT